MSAMAVAGAALAACAPKPAKPAEPEQPAAVPEKKPVTLTFWGFATNRNRWYIALADEYKKEHPEVTIDVQEIAYAEMHDKVLTTLVAGTGAPDIADIEISRFGQYCKGERVGFLPLNDWIAGDLGNLYQRSALDPWSWEGKYYGLGNELNASLLFYRHDLLSAAGIEYPFSTWEELTQKGLEYVAKTGKKFAPISGWWGHWYIIAQAFGGFFNEEGEPVFDNAGGVRTMQMLADWMWKDEIGVRIEQEWAQMMADEHAITLGAPWYQGFMKDNAADLKGKWEMQLLPTWADGQGVRSGSVGGTGTCITEQSKAADVAWDYLRFCNLTNEGVLLGFEMQNLYPTWKPAWDDPRMQFKDPYFNNQQPYEFITEGARYMPPLWNSPWWPEVTDAFGREVVTPVLDKERRVPVDEAMKACRAEVERIMKG
jgi:arabinosaccharide transport system substrate-binding protein